MNLSLIGAAHRREPALRGSILLSLLLVGGLAQAQPNTGLGGSADGGTALLEHALLPEVRMGRLAPQFMPCFPQDGRTYRNGAESSNASAPSVGLPGGPSAELQTGHIANTGLIHRVNGQRTAEERAKVSDVSLLGGLIQADSIEAVSHTDELGLQGGHTLLSNLRIAGVPVAQYSPAPNTVLTPLNSALPPGLRIVLNEQRQGRAGQQLVNGLHVIVDDFAGYSGHIRVARATTRTIDGRPTLRAVAYGFAQRHQGAAGTDGGQSESGRQNPVQLACRSDYRQSVQAGAVLPGLATLGQLTSEVEGNAQPQARATSRVLDVNLMNGLVTADAVTSVADSYGQGGVMQSSGAESTFVGLSLGGQPIGQLLPQLAGGIPANTRISGDQLAAAICPLDPLGTACAVASGVTLWLNRQQCRANGARVDPTQCFAGNETRLTVTGIQLIVGASNLAAGAQAGSNLRVAVAHSAVRP